MRFSHVILALCGLGASASGALVGCGNSDTGGGSGGSTGSSTATTGTTSTGSGTPACAPKASCDAVDKECLGLVDNTGQSKFGLRMSDLVISKPTVLGTGLVASLVTAGVIPSDATCNLNGEATFSWLLQFDTTANTLKTGGAKPVTDPTMGYDFDDEMVTQGSQMFHIAPVTFPVTVDSSGKFDISTGMEIIVPIYLDTMATMVVILPLQQSKLTMGTISSSHNCIGSYNAAGLDPANSCKSDATHPLFNTGAGLEGIITLEDADNVTISELHESLCVLLAGASNGMANSAGITVCKRDANNAIIFQGDACSTEGGTCKDSISLAATFAASSVKINN